VPVVNVVGDHATYHKRYNVQLESDIETVARNVSSWVRWSLRSEDLGADAAEAVAAAMGPPGQVATLIVRHVCGSICCVELYAVTRPPVSSDQIDAVAKILRSDEPCALLVGGSVVRERGLTAASRVANATGAKLLCETFPTRIERGAGLPPVERLAYLAEFAGMQMEGLKHMILVDAKPPVSFFAYPGKPSYLVPEGCEVHVLARDTDDAPGALEALAEATGAAKNATTIQPAARPGKPSGALTAETVCQAIGALLPGRRDRAR
jgi:acetolactate synthase-1/2/3 large subunit